MINYKSILAGEVRRRKYFRRMAKKCHNQWRKCEEELSDLRSEMFYLRIENKRLNGDLTSEIDRRVKDGIAAERFAIEYDYCQKIDALEAKLAVYETSKIKNEDGVVGMVLSPEQCNRLNAELKRLQRVEKLYQSVCDMLKRIKRVINEATIIDKTNIS